MAKIQAAWVGKTPEEYAKEKEFYIKFLMRGEITISAKDKEQAIEKAKEIPNFELLEYIDDVEFE